MSSCFLHVDLDAFFASVEQLDNPEYKGKAVIVGGLPGDKRSVVSTCSYEARKYGVHSAMPTSTAYKLCPNGIYLRGRMERYHEKSKEVMKIFYDFSPDVQQMSVDEAFIDITGTELLFGPPEECAKKLKEKVYKETGLTVSVGIAYNKYIAKIASGIDKPNGLFFVQEGKEEEFMLSLPLSKLWGAGTKTQEKLKSFGFLTTKDIHNAHITTLETLFGSCTGTFLYNAVRGKEVESFSDKVKSHSISAEETYSYDLTDIFTIETALLKLCYDVRFRLLDEDWNSKTLNVKIRYEDFTTVSVQCTYPRMFSSLEDIYEKACSLFKSKYQYGKGIRLLGVGTHNLEKGIYSKEVELFDFGEEKKQKIEETVLKLQKKNPKSKITKARQLIKKGLIISFLAINLFFTGKTWAEEQKETVLYVEGDWEANLKQNITFNFQNKNSYITFSPFIFTQNASMSIFFIYNNQWFLDAVFQDGFENNKFVIEYRNLFDTGIYTNVKFGNKNIGLSSDYGTVNLGKSLLIGKNTDFGFYGNFEKSFTEEKKIKSEVILRFDNFETFSKTWDGNYLSTESQIELNSFIPNKYFDFPFDINFTEIYEKNEEKQFLLIPKDKYLFYPVKNQLVFTKSLENETVLVIKDKVQTKEYLLQYIKSLKNWFSEIPLKDFLAFLGITEKVNNIEELSTNHLEHFFTTVNEKDALYIFKAPYFSLFENKNIFSIQNKNYDDIKIIFKSANKPYSPDSFLFWINQAGNLVFSRNISQENPNSFIENLFPLGNVSPYIYFLPKSLGTTNVDFAISITDLVLEENYNIGTKAEQNSVVAYVNGVLTFSTYEEETGNVIFEKRPNPEDKVQIFWKEHSKNGQLPTLLGAAGLQVDFTPNLTMESALSFSKPYKNIFSSINQGIVVNKENALAFQQSVQASTTLDYAKDFGQAMVKLKNSAGIEYIDYNVGNKYSVYTAEQYKTEKKNYFSYDSVISGNGKTEQVHNQYYAVVGEINSDSEISEVEFFLPSNKNILLESQAFILEAKISDLDLLNNYNIYFEIGDSNSTYARWILNPPNILENQESLSTNFKEIFLSISNLQRAFMGNCETGKIIFERIGSESPFEKTGTLTIKSIQYENTGFVFDSGIETENLFFMGQPSTKITIRDIQENNFVKKYLYPLPLNQYKNFQFMLYIPESFQEGIFEIALLEYSDSGIFVEENKVLSKDISFSDINKNHWETFTINLENESISDSSPSVLLITIKNLQEEALNQSFYIGNIDLVDSKSDFLISDVLLFDYSFGKVFSFNTKITGNYAPLNEKKSLYGNFSTSLVLDFDSITFENQLVSDYNFLDFKNSENNLVNLNYISHNIKSNKLLNFIAFSENYGFNPMEKAFFKGNYLETNFNALLDFFPLLLQLNSEIRENNEDNFGNILVRDNFVAKLEYENYNSLLSIDINQKTQNKSNTLFSNNYFTTYGKAYYYQVFPQRLNSFERKESFSLVNQFSLNKLNIKPKVKIIGENQFVTKAINPILQSLEYNIILPFSFLGNKIELSYSENVVSQLISNNNSQNFWEDFSLYFQNDSMFSILLPFTSKNKILFETKKSVLSNGNRKNHKIVLSLSKNIFANLWDLVIPSNISLEFNKTFSASKFDLIEENTFSGKLFFTSFNLFGKRSPLEVFSWYEQEEIISNFVFSYQNENWKLGYLNGINIYITDNSFISHNLETSFTFKNHYDYSIIEKLGWNRAGKTAYLIPLIKIFNKDFTPFNIQRYDGLDFSIKENGKDFAFNTECNVNHKVSVYVLEKFSVNTEVVFGYSAKTQKDDFQKSFNFSYSLSGKVSF